MRYNIHFACISHIGKIRSINQDNFICNGTFAETNGNSMECPLCGTKRSDETPVFGIFDGMGGEECGEVASFIAAKLASSFVIGKDIIADLAQFCQKANQEICDYAEANKVSAMGTTAAMLVFAAKEVVLCNIGDSKVFRMCDGMLEQISKDHVSVSAFGVKPPLSQNLGIPPEELIIDPYFARGKYHRGDVYLICSDGLTDMVTLDDITEVLTTKTLEEAAVTLLDKALANGGKDNISVILCRVERRFGWRFRRKHHTKEGSV